MASGYRSVRLHPSAVRRLLSDDGQPVHRHLARIGDRVTRAAKQVADERLQTGTGAYKAGFVTTTIRGAGTFRIVVANIDRKATWIENGTPPHLILPRRATILRFTSRSGGVVFARQVNHPGTKPYRILATALRRGLAGV